MKDIVLLAVSIYLLKRRDTHYEGRNLRSKSGSLAKFAAMRRASPPVSRLVADRRPGSFFKMNVYVLRFSAELVGFILAWGDCPASSARFEVPLIKAERIRSAPNPDISPIRPFRRRERWR